MPLGSYNRIIVAILSALTFVGCSSLRIEQSNIIGKWVSNSKDGQFVTYEFEVGGHGTYSSGVGSSRAVQRDIYWEVRRSRLRLREILDFNNHAEYLHSVRVKSNVTGGLSFRIKSNDRIFVKQAHSKD